MELSSQNYKSGEYHNSIGEDAPQWRDWRWQIAHTVRSLSMLEKVLGITFPPEEREKLQETIDKFPLAATPYYLSLIKTEDYANDPIFRQAVPVPDELRVEECELEDPLAEDSDSPVPGITHRYPDRVLFLVSNVCAMYCRHCTRKRKVGDRDRIPTWEEMEVGITYIREHPEVRDVLLSGGDPLMLPDDLLDRILTQLRAIPHVEVIRIGSRTPVVLPFRITDGLVNVLKKHQPIWLNTHFNHPQEITPSAEKALAKLADAGIPLGNQSVLLAGVNDCPRIMKSLVQKLVKNRVRPYYLYQCDLSEGLSHFRTPVGKGIEIMENLIGHTSGFAVPTYVIDAPGGGGKIPVMPTYLISYSTNKVILRNFEGVITTYREPDNYTSIFCDRNCKDCSLQLKLEAGDEQHVVGIAKLLSDYDEATALVPADSERMARREDEEE
ncbi:lysine 2,3-aminomutase [Methanocalculus chunghsingensis]|uniref:lysine 2,3-aminomutase n=1 Tax=Methanocalculus chunghsingensis TaxID=156457 RepID=UPI001B8D9574|nr:lysine 2,3-aminomutase [Methanocalculus chunghsingensis]